MAVDLDVDLVRVMRIEPKERDICSLYIHEDATDEVHNANSVRFIPTSSSSETRLKITITLS